MHIDGACQCGNITYEAEIDPAQVAICHCTDCQMLTGSAFRITVLTPRTNIRLTGAEPKVYTKSGDNGRKRLQFFCGNCGSYLDWEHEVRQPEPPPVPSQQVPR